MLITTLRTRIFYISLHVARKVGMQVKRKVFWQAGDDFRMWVAPTLCRRVGELQMSWYGT